MTYNSPHNKENFKEIKKEATRLGKESYALAKRIIHFSYDQITDILQNTSFNRNTGSQQWKILGAGIVTAMLSYEGTQMFYKYSTQQFSHTKNNITQREKIPTTKISGNSTYIRYMQKQEAAIAQKKQHTK